MIAEVILEEADKLERERLKKIARAWLAYQGDLPPALKAVATDPDARDNVRLNVCRLIVDTGVGYLFPPDTKISAGDEEGGAVDQALTPILAANRIGQALFKLAVNGAVAGHAFLKVVPGRTGSDLPRILVLDPSTVTMFHEMDDIDDIYAYRIQWNGVDWRTNRPYVRRQIIERNEMRTAWTVTDQISRSSTGSVLGMVRGLITGRWEPIGPPFVHPYSWSPLHHCQNLPAANMVWGSPDLDDDIVALNAALNANRSYVQRITRLYAHPQPVVKGARPEDVILGADRILSLPGSASIELLEMRSDLEGTDTAYTRMMDAIHSVSSLPQVATGRTEDLGALSGVALQILYGPLVMRTQTKRQLYGPMLQDAFSHALELAGQTVPATDITIIWPEILPVDEKSQAETAEIQQRIGVSRDTLIARLGFDSEAEAENRQSEIDTEAEVGTRLLNAFERGQMRQPPPQ